MYFHLCIYLYNWPNISVYLTFSSFYLYIWPNISVFFSYCSIYLYSWPNISVFLSYCSIYLESWPNLSVFLSYWSIYLESWPNISVFLSYWSIYLYSLLFSLSISAILYLSVSKYRLPISPRLKNKIMSLQPDVSMLKHSNKYSGDISEDQINLNLIKSNNE